MQNNSITGRVHAVSPIEEFPSRNSERVFRRRTLTLDATRHDPYTGERGYDNFPSVEFTADKVGLLDELKVGQVVTVYYDLQGSKYEKDGQTRYFTRVRGYKIELREKSDAPRTNETENTAQIFPSKPAQQEEDDGLPF